MTRTGWQDEDLYRLFDDLCDGSISQGDAARLDDLLRTDAAARWEYLCYLDVHAGLGLVGAMDGERGTEDERPAPDASVPCGGAHERGSSQGSGFRVQGSDSGSHPRSFTISPFPTIHYPLSTIHSFVGGVLFSYLTAALILGVGMLIAWAWEVPDHAQIARQPLPTARERAHELEPNTESVGRITGMIDCQWADASTATFNGAPVPLGRKYALASGLVEITCRSGAKVILQGPVTYDVESKNGGFLSVGKLTAKLEKRGEKSPNLQISKSPSPSLSTIHYPLFTIRTPTATVTDLGTEFGVEVRDSGATLAHVFRGSVEVQLAARDGRQGGQAMRLSENESARIEPDNSSAALAVRRVAADPAVFVRVEQLSELAEDVKLKPFRRWQAYSQQLRRDPSLLAYYDFQLKPGFPGVLPDVAQTGRGACDGVVENATWTTGRMPGKHALLFNGPADYVRINLPQKTDDLTLAAWVCFDALAPGDGRLSSGLLMSEGWLTSGQIHWQVDNRDGHVGFSSVGCTVGKGNAITRPVIGAKQLGQWLHLAFAYDRAEQRVHFFAQGRSVGDVEYGMNVPVSIGRARIGNWNEGPRNFRGRMDELAVFGRPLTADEMRRMYEQGESRP